MDKWQIETIEKAGRQAFNQYQGNNVNELTPKLADAMISTVVSTGIKRFLPSGIGAIVAGVGSYVAHKAGLDGVAVAAGIGAGLSALYSLFHLGGTGLVCLSRDEFTQKIVRPVAREYLVERLSKSNC